jgi:glycosyltransferase involved in cell wall biosynthesis
MEWKSSDLDLYNREVKDRIEVYKAHAPRFSSIGQPLFSSHFMDKWILKMETIFFEDRFDWALGVRHEAMELVRRRNIDLIYTTGPPHSVHFLGYYVKKHTGIPWVMDFRDPMSKRVPTLGLGRLNGFSEELKKRTLLSIYERIFVRNASCVITATEPITQDLKVLYPHNAPKITTITNGFDEEDFLGIAPRKVDIRRFSLIYTGRFWSHEPLDFLEGIKIALKHNPILRSDLGVFFIGELAHEHAKLLGDAEFDGIVHSPGAVSHREAISYQLGAGANLLLVSRSEAEGGGRILTGKFFEYLRAGRPILAVVPRGVAWELIGKHKLGYAVHPKDHAGIAKVIISLHKKWQENGLDSSMPSPAVLQHYDRRNLTERLARIFTKSLS